MILVLVDGKWPDRYLLRPQPLSKCQLTAGGHDLKGNLDKASDASPLQIFYRSYWTFPHEPSCTKIVMTTASYTIKKTAGRSARTEHLWMILKHRWASLLEFFAAHRCSGWMEEPFAVCAGTAHPASPSRLSPWGATRVQ